MRLVSAACPCLWSRGLDHASGRVRPKVLTSPAQGWAAGAGGVFGEGSVYQSVQR